MSAKVYLISIIHWLFVIYTAFIFVRIILSWLPAWQYKKWAQFIIFYTDPFLNIFRRLVPPLGGVLDLSPMLAFFALKIFEAFIVGLLR